MKTENRELIKFVEPEEKYRISPEEMNGGYFEVDIKGNFTFVNDFFCKFTGLSKEELLGTSSRDIIAKNNLDKVYKNFNQLFTGEVDRVIFYTEVLKHDGEIRFIEGMAYLKFDSKGNKIGFYAFTRDNTEHKLAVQNLKEAKEKYRELSNILEDKVEERTLELKNSEEKVRNLINNISDVIMEGDIDGAISFISPQIYDIIGYQPNELIGIDLLEFIHPDEKKAYIQMRNITPEVRNKFYVELRALHKKGYYVPISVKGSIEKINDKLKIIVIIRDITKQRKIDNLMRRQIKKLKELDQIRSDLIIRISHELKTPLTLIYNGSQYLLDYSNETLSDQTQEILMFINKGGYRLKSLVDDLINAYSIESSELSLDLNRENLIPIIKKCIENEVPYATIRGILINVELLNELFLEVDKSKIEKVISILLSNAIKNTPPNGNIYITTFEHPNYIELAIRDDGIGFTKNEIPLLFKRFGKIERYGKGLDVDIEGVGLGLYIANEFVKLHNGEIIVKSKGRNKGSTFIVRLHLN